MSNQPPMKVNIFYLTNQCNLRCEYCYEKDAIGEPFFADVSQVRPYMEDLLQREPASVGSSSLCLMGGEPMMAFPLIESFWEEAARLNRDHGKSVCLNIISNGTLVHKHLDSLRRMINSQEAFLGLDISFDGSEQFRRTGDSQIVHENLLRLKEAGIPTAISYTLSYQPTHQVVLEDLVTIIEKYMIVGHPNFQRTHIRVNLNWRHLGTDGTPALEEWKRILRGYGRDLFKAYRIPICEYSCSTCRWCQKSLYGDNHYAVPRSDGTVDTLNVKKGAQHAFDHFNHTPEAGAQEMQNSMQGVLGFLNQGLPIGGQTAFADFLIHKK